MTIVVLLFGWGLIYAGAIYEGNIQDYFRSLGANEFFGEWSATVIMTFVNYFIPSVIGKISKLEAWDFAFEILYADLWKNFYTSLINLIFFMGIQLVSMRSNEELDPDESSYQCKEDGVVDSFLKLFVAEVVLRYTFYIYWILHHKVKSLLYKDYDWK
jgi:hypothetical protein